jgi:hypothetical protein
LIVDLVDLVGGTLGPGLWEAYGGDLLEEQSLFVLHELETR